MLGNMRYPEGLDFLIILQRRMKYLRHVVFCHSDKEFELFEIAWVDWMDSSCLVRVKYTKKAHYLPL